MSEKKRLVVVDLSSFIFRAFYAIRPLHAPDGTPVNAVHGVLSMLMKLLSDYRPTHLILAKDSKGPSFRKEMYDDYKANRSEPPEELGVQFPLIDKLIEKMGLPNISQSGFEADDLIGSIAVQWREDADEILIVSGDKDLMQFVDEKVKMVDTMKDIIYGREEVYTKMGVYPEQVVDYLSIVGDSSDNVPGIKGVGPKGAIKVLSQYRTLEECLENADKLPSPKMIKAFQEHEKEARLSKELITIKTDIDLGTEFEETKTLFHPEAELINYLKDLGLRSMVNKMQDISFNEAQITEQEVPVSSIEFTESDILPSSGEVFIFKDEDDFFFSYEKDGVLFAGSSKEIAQSQDLFLISNDLKSFFKNGLSVKDSFDLSIGHFVLNPEGKHDLRTIVEAFAPSSDSSPKAIAVRALLSYREIIQELKEKNLLKVYDEIDGPLIPILANMESSGVMINVGQLKKLEEEYAHKLIQIEHEINAISGNPVNLKSPKQVAHLLFEILGFPVVRKTKTGYSTDSDVLEELSALSENDVPDLILQYREIDKLLSTYITVLPNLIDLKTRRVHTHYMQNVAQTGRLSSVNPNLQNIPIRSSNGRRIRTSFMATPGKLFLSADYSQVELRLLAHFSQDPTMVRAFTKGEDIHAQTAAEVSEIPLSAVTDKERSLAKAVNFGLMYGQSSFGLAGTLKIDRKTAKEYITRYFERFGAVKTYLDSLKTFCEENGYAQTMHGRKRFLPNITSKNRMVKSQAERVAVNSPIQGTAADIIKLAMINIDKEFKTRDLKSQMIMQVHDELIFEVTEDELELVKGIVKDKMENVVELTVPLTVQIGIGVNWFDLK